MVFHKNKHVGTAGDGTESLISIYLSLSVFVFTQSIFSTVNNWKAKLQKHHNCRAEINSHDTRRMKFNTVTSLFESILKGTR